MKFTCERCGKRFASVDEPTSGRVYRIKCKCGNVIHITAPHLDDGKARPGSLPPLDRPRITGATAMPSVTPPATTPRPGTRSAISAGDATSRVHAGAASTATRIPDPAVPRRTEPAVRSPAARATTGSRPIPAAAAPVRPAAGTRTIPPVPEEEDPFAAARAAALGTEGAPTPVAAAAAKAVTGASRTATGATPAPARTTSTLRGGIPRVEPDPHPHATPMDELGLPAESPLPELDLSLFEPGPATPPPRAPAPPFARSSSVGTPAQPVARPVPTLGTSYETTSEVHAPGPLPETSRATPPVARPPATEPPRAEIPAAAAPDPFAAVAAHAARMSPFDTAAPVATTGASSPGGEEESVDLSISEQYPIPKKKRRSRLLVPAVAVVALAAIGGAAAYVLVLRKPAPAPIAAAPPRPPAAVAPVTPPAPPAPVTAAAPAPTPPPAAAAPVSPPAVAAAAPAPPPPAPPVVAAKPPAAAEPPPKAAPTPPESPKVVAAPAPPPPAAKPAAPKAAPPEKPKKAEPAKTAAKVAAAAAVASAAKEPEKATPAPAPPAPPPAPPPVAAKPPPPAPPPPPVAAAPKPPPPAPTPAAAEPPPAPSRPTKGLDPQTMQAIIAKNRPAFDVCVERALQDPVTAAFAGRRAALLLLIAPTGKAEAALEDADLDASPFGACLRRVASKMAFPTFQGDDVGARIVLVLGKN